MQPGTADLVKSFHDMRQQFRMLKTGPHKKVKTGLMLTGVNADVKVKNETQYFRMMEISRDIVENDPVVGSGLRRLVANVVGSGFSPDPDTGDGEVDLVLKEKWAEYAEQPEIQGAYSFVDLERINLMGILRDGDGIGITVVDDDGVGRLEMFEGHQLRDPSKYTKPDGHSVFCGVEVDKHRRRVAYHLAPGVDATRGSKSVRVSAVRDDGIPLCIHSVLPSRLTQTRGLPIVQPISDFIDYHDSIQMAQLVKQQAASCFMLLRSKAMGSPVFGGTPANTTKEKFSDGFERSTSELYPGKEITGEPGETISGFSPNVPNQEYFNHVSMILQIIAVNLDLPVQLLLLDPTKTNFSGWRGALDQAKYRWTEIQSSLISAFHSKVWAWKANEWMQTEPYLARAAGRLQNYSKATWNPPTWPYIEPMKDAQADAFIVQHRLNSPRRIYMARGMDYDVVLPEIISDNTDAIIQAKIAARNINAGYDDGSPVDWREVLSVPVPQTINQSWSRSELMGGGNGQFDD